jgi:hypothetical protein
MKDQKKILYSLNVLHTKFNKDPDTNQESSARKVSTSISHSRKDDHMNDRKSISMRRCHHYPRKYNKITHAISGLGRSPSVSLVRRWRRSLEANILQGEIRKIKPQNFNGEHRKGEKVEA